MNRPPPPEDQPQRDIWAAPRQKREYLDNGVPGQQWGRPPSEQQWRMPGEERTSLQQGWAQQPQQPPTQQGWAQQPQQPPPEQYWMQPQQAWALPEQQTKPPERPPKRAPRRSIVFAMLFTGILLVVLLIMLAVGTYPFFSHLLATHNGQATATPNPTPTPTPIPFNPNVGAVLPTHRVVAFYGIPNAEPTGPAYTLSDAMLSTLQQQGAAYEQIDPTHPVQLGIDLVADVADGSPGPNGYYSHALDPDQIQSYIDFCQQHHLILFLDLQIGLAPVMQTVDYFLPYLERYSFVHLAIDPEWMFPRHNGIPGINLSNIRATDLNPIIEAVAEIPMKYHVPRKMLLIHQYRGDGDGLANPYDAGGPGKPEFADKANLLFDPRVDVIIHTDGVGGYSGDREDKTWEYDHWVVQDMQQYHNFLYGGFKLFYHLEKKTLMSPQDVLGLTPPPPLVITYGN